MLEGVGKALDPNLDLLIVAGPYLLFAAGGGASRWVWRLVQRAYHAVFGDQDTDELYDARVTPPVHYS